MNLGKEEGFNTKITWKEYLDYSYKMGLEITHKFLELFKQDILDTPAGLSDAIGLWNDYSNTIKNIRLVFDRVLIKPYIEPKLNKFQSVILPYIENI